MQKIFDVPDGLPRKYTYGAIDSVQAQEDRRRIANSLAVHGSERGGLIIISLVGVARFKEDFSEQAVPIGSSALCFQSFFPKINPYPVGSTTKMPVFGAGISRGLTAFRPEVEDEDLEGSDLNLIKNGDFGVGYERCWEFLLRTAQHLSEVGVSRPSAHSIASNSPDRRGSRDTDSLLDGIAEVLGEL